MDSVITSKQDRIKVADIELDVVCSNFGNRVLLLVTELQKLGTVLEVTWSTMDQSSYVYSVTTLLGKDDAEIHVFGRAIASHLQLPPNTSLLLGLGLKDNDPTLISSLLPKLEPFRTWPTTQSNPPPPNV